MSAVVLRSYQEQFIGEVREQFRLGRRRVLGVSPTGSGKTVCFAWITETMARTGKRVVITAHRVEIVQQISEALDRLGVRHGRIQPGHHATEDLVQVAMVQTLARRLASFPEPALLVVDEAHHAAAGTWKDIADAWRRAWHLGVTATPRRLDGKGLGDCFDTLVRGPEVADLIRAGHLAGYDYLAPPEKADLSGVRSARGDFVVAELAEAMDRATVTGDAVEHYRRHLAGRPAIAFCVTVAHAESVAAQFREAGFRAAAVDGEMPPRERRDLIAAIGDGRLNVLTSCQIISEGTDIPAVAGAILLRPTQSLSMFLQQVGRALRPKADSSRAIVLDHVGNLHRHGLPDAVRKWSLDGRKKGEGAPPVAVCRGCHHAFPMRPGWKDEAECRAEADDDTARCILGASGPRRGPEFVAGTLVAISAAPAWAEGIPLASAKGNALRRLMQLADTGAKLREIARARGYRSGWVEHVLRERAEAAARGRAA